MDSDYGVPRELSDLQKQRALYRPGLPPCLQVYLSPASDTGTTVRVEFGDATTTSDPAGAHVISQAFPHTYGQSLAHFLRPTAKVPDAQIIVEQSSIRVGVVFCGRQSPGGHNVIWGLHSAIKSHNPNSTLLGFVGGTEGLFAKKTLEITDHILSTYKNQGCKDKSCCLPAFLCISPGVTSNTDAAQLAETFAELKCSTKVNSQLISNVCTDALSAEKICDAVQARAEKDKYHGVILIPEGLVESIPELYALLQLLLHPESDDSAQLSQIETEKLLAQLVETEMNKRLVLGHVCYHILAAGLNGYMATITNLKNPVNKWRCGAAPITAMMTVKRWSHGPGAMPIGKPAIHPATVDLKGKAYENPGPLQFDGPGADAKAISLCVEDQDYMGRIKLLQEYLDKVRSIVKPGCPQEVLKAALSSMASVTDVLSVMSSSSLNGQTPL
ncbi:pyrophosphate--fructose 6-phosphate 1-phosphotransferase [Musa troglodytarum]|uniref:Pyrophosphate--fructose 6-phosphate 1-phosphotransferase n=1 Tax=Musa troglodytarum TaxID=320322 RepID=A0A9E7GI00_9LILI|nr:pyrophosphate--fructose 6-phosphate 1-phosphotransferase [Musa troglodytarum]